METAASSGVTVCPVCGAEEFTSVRILWPELIAEWELSPAEVDYVDLQQGFSCVACKNNLRSMTLAAAMTKAFRFSGNLSALCRTGAGIRSMRVVEINPAGHLTPILGLLPGHELHSYPEFDMQQMNIESASVDIVIHSDTLEHVPDSQRPSPRRRGS